MRCARRLHPDKGGDKEAFQQLTDAYHAEIEARDRVRHSNRFTTNFGFEFSGGRPFGFAHAENVPDPWCSEGAEFSAEHEGRGDGGAGTGVHNAGAGSIAREIAEVTMRVREDAEVALEAAGHHLPLRRRAHAALACSPPGPVAEASELAATILSLSEG